MIKIGIDPDNKKSGFCILLRNQVTELTTLDFFELQERLLELKEYYEGCLQKYVVVVEKGEDNGYLYNARIAASKARVKDKIGVAAKAGSDAGKNFEISNQIIKWCIYKDIPYKVYVPKGKKWNHKYTSKLVKGLSKQTNQEKRDAIRAAVMG